MLKENLEKIDERILILAPSGQDSLLAASILENAGMTVTPCGSMSELCAELKRGAGVILVAEEALRQEALVCLKEELAAQEPWSDIPMTILTLRNSERNGLDIFNLFGLNANVNLLERTFRPVTLISVLRVALRARKRQYQVRDLFEKLKQSTEELQRSNHELEQFAYVSSHDLQEPLRTITSYADLLVLRQKDKLDQDARQYLDYMQEGALHAQELIQGLLGYASITKRDYPFEPADFEAIVKNALSHLKVAVQERGAEVTHDPLPTLNVNTMQISQLFQNLISNGIKYCKEKPKVHISASPKEGKWIFSVRDNGIGIDPQFQKRVFMIFKRLHAKHEYPGTGIGLAVCKKIVEQHGGEIWLESKPGQGSTFYFSLPLSGKAAHAHR
jgi:signal transduction histidine kinase